MIALIDYGAGNLTSVRKALHAIDADVHIPRDPSELDDAMGVIVPGVGNFLSTSAMTAGRARQRVSSGIPDLDALLDGGLLRDSITLVAGPTGVGKTLVSLEFLASAAALGERTLLLGYEESAEQIGRNAVGVARGFDRLRAADALRVVSTYPEEASLEDHLLELKQLVDDYQPVRLVIDSLTALERAGSAEAFREFVVGLTSYAKANDITTYVTASTGGPNGGTSLTEGHVSTLADNVLTLRYVEEPGQMRRALTVLKTRGSAHDMRVREVTISDDGIRIGEPLDRLAGIVAGPVEP